jgi:hypothetical protein
MRYSLWSRGRLLGYTDLDIHTVSPTMRQGFIEPVPEGKPLLEDATSVWRAMAERKRSRRARGGDDAPGDSELVQASLDRREALDLELRDEQGGVFECEFMQIYDRFDLKNGAVDAMEDTEEEQEAQFEIYLSSLSPEGREKALAQRADTDAEIEEFVAELKEEWGEMELFGSGWPPLPPEDPRWDTMQYHLQVHLKSSFDDDLSFLESED